MLTEAIRLRLESLSRGAANGPARAAPHVDADLSLPALAPGVVEQTGAGDLYAIRSGLLDAWPAGRRELARFQEWAADAAGRAADEGSPLAQFPRRFPGGTLFLDLETCGFAGSPIFLVGLVHQDAGGLVLEQFLARDYTEEPALLEALAWRLARSELLVTFNGKSFDWPMVRDRAVVHRFQRYDGLARDLAHLDLLHVARRRWRGQLPNCKLQTLERYFCRRVRNDDVPGSRIPAEYHHFVRTGDARQMKSILHHNALDLVTLVQLAIRLAGP